MYELNRIFCATSWELEAERRAFYEVLGDFNENVAMPLSVLYVPVSLLNVRDKRPLQYSVDENIRDCRHYILALCDNWGPTERDFRRDYQLALECSAYPSLPMREVALLLRQPAEGQTVPADLPTPARVFSTTAEFKQEVQKLLSLWLTTLLSEASPGAIRNCMSVSRRPETFSDQPFLHRLLIERTSQELALDHLPAPLQEQVLTMQVNLRLSSVRENYADGSSEIIMLDGKPAGWIYFRETQEEVHLVEVIVLGEFRGRGIGTAIIKGLAEAASSAGKPVRLRVNVTNEHAIRLYQSLGFRRTGGDDVQHEMEL